MDYKDIAKQTETNYLEYKKIKRFEDTGYFLENYIVSGGEVTKNVYRNNFIDVSTVVAVLNEDVVKREGVTLKLKEPNTTYFLDFYEGDFWLQTTHPIGTEGDDYLTLATIYTNSYGNVDRITDRADPRGGFRLKSHYGLSGYMRPIVNVMDFGVKGDGVTDDTDRIELALNQDDKFVYFPKGIYVTSKYIPLQSDTVITTNEAVIKGYGFQAVGKKNIEISGFKFTSDTLTGSQPRVGVWIDDCNDINITNCKFENTRLYLRNTNGDQSSKNFNISNNYFTGDFQGFGSNTNILNCSGLSKVVISGNIFECLNVSRFMKLTTSGSVESGDGYNVIGDSYSKNLIVTNNVITGSLKDGSQVIDGFAGVGESVVSNNVIQIDSNSIAGSAIEFKSSGQEPTLTGTNKQKNLIISDNVITCPSSVYNIMAYGAYGLPFERDLQKIIISGNIINNNRTGTDPVEGIRVRGWHQLSVVNNQIDIVSTGRYVSGIRVGACLDALVTGNVITSGSIVFEEQPSDTTAFTFSKPFESINVSNNIVHDWRREGGITFNVFHPSKVMINISNNYLHAVTTTSPNSWAIYFAAGEFNHVAIQGNNSNAEDNSSRNSVARPNAVFNSYSEVDNSWNPKISYGSGIPALGNYRRGDIVYNTNAAAGVYIGWVCVQSGSPGDWRGFGLIETLEQ